MPPIINALGADTHTYPCMIKSISRNQACTGLWLAGAWFKILKVGIVIKSKETSSQLSSLDIAIYKQHWVLFVSVHENTIPAG